MPENPETKPEEAKPQGEKPSEAQPRQGGRQYVDYDKLSSEDAAVMLKRIRARMKRIERDIDVIMAILKYGPQGGSQAPQGQGEGHQRQYGRQGGYKRNYRRNYGYSRRRQKRESEEDVNYE
jgi:hypothetical protein